MDYLTIVGSIVGIISGVVTTIPILNKLIFRKKQLNNELKNDFDNSKKQKSNLVIQFFNFNEFNSINYMNKDKIEVKNYNTLRTWIFQFLFPMSCGFIIYVGYTNLNKLGMLNSMSWILTGNKFYDLILYTSKNVCFYMIIIQIILSSLVILKMIVYKNSFYRIFNICVYVITIILALLFYYYFNSITIERNINNYSGEFSIIKFTPLISLIQPFVIMLFNIETYVILSLGELKSEYLENTKDFNLWKIIYLLILFGFVIFWYYVK